VLTVPDQSPIFIYCLDAMKRHAVFVPFFIYIMKKIMIARDKGNLVKGQFNQSPTDMVEKPQFKLSLAKLGIPVHTLE